MALEHSEITGEIIGCAMEVHRILGQGFQEYIYHKALEKELKEKHIPFISEFEMKVYYKGDVMGYRRVDFLVRDLICVEIKALTELTDVNLAQGLNYLEASEYKIGLLINFGGKSLQFKRLQKKIKG